MALKIKSQHVIALIITAGIAGWMATGDVKIGGQGGATAAPIADREAERSSELFKVRYLPLQQQERIEQVSVRGRTQADAIVPVRAETAGILQRRLVDKGDRVQAGDLVCEIESGTREASLAEAEASLVQAEADFQANEALSKKGFAAENRLKQFKAALDAARARLAQAQWELDKTGIHAQASGIVQDPIAEVGDMLSMGATCVTLIDSDPMLFIGQVSERDIAKVEPGKPAAVTLITGETIDGEVEYVAPSADAQTRTFRVEISIPNPDRTIRDGMTANAEIELEPSLAYRISPSWISLADSGEIGLKMLDENDVVKFVPIEILAQTNDGFWVSGPAQGERVITFGQEYVLDGETVIAVPDPLLKAEATGTSGQADSGEATQ